MVIDVKDRWVIQRPDGKFILHGNVWGYDLAKTDTWVCEDFAKRAAEMAGGGAYARKATMTISMELAEEPGRPDETASADEPFNSMFKELENDPEFLRELDEIERSENNLSEDNK